MITFPKTVLLLAGTCAAAVFGLAGCDNPPAKADAVPQTQAAVGTTTSPTEQDKALAAQLRAPPLPDPSRTDPEAAAMRERYVEWKVAQTKVAGDAALKQTNLFLGTGNPAPKGNYGRMPGGLPQAPADKN